MKLRVDRSADALYLRLDDSTIAESEEVSPGVVLDYSESGEVVGIELIHLSRRSSGVELSTLEFRDRMRLPNKRRTATFRTPGYRASPW